MSRERRWLAGLLVAGFGLLLVVLIGAGAIGGWMLARGLPGGGGPPVMRTVLSDGIIIAVNLYCATNSSFCSYSTGYSMKRLCLTHSMMPMRHSRSLPARSVKGMVGKRSLT